MESRRAQDQDGKRRIDESRNREGYRYRFASERTRSKRSSILENSENLRTLIISSFFEPSFEQSAPTLSNWPGQTLANIPHSRITLTLEEDKGSPESYDLSYPGDTRCNYCSLLYQLVKLLSISPGKEKKKEKNLGGIIKGLGGSEGRRGETVAGYRYNVQRGQCDGDLLMFAKIEKRRKKRSRSVRVVTAALKRERAE